MAATRIPLRYRTSAAWIRGATHDPKFDIPLLETALRLDVAYVGAMGSRRSHSQRLESRLAAGGAPEEAARLPRTLQHQEMPWT